MKRIALVFALILVVAPAMYAASWTGWITDEHCAAKGNNADHKGCALKCAKEHNAKLVFYNNADQKIYKLDNQELALKNVGHEVTVSGDLAGDSIKVSGIEESKSASK
jgi:hypothetical protein